MALPNELYDINASAGIWLRVILIVAATIIVARFTERFSGRYLQRAATRLRVSATKYIALRRLIIALIYVTGLIIIISLTPQLQSISVAILASVSIIGIIVGIAAQNTISNVIAGIAIVVFKPFGVGDFITVRGDSGFVEDITFRHTVIRLVQGHMIIPNSVITSDVLFNHSNDRVSNRLDMRVSYDSDLALAKQIIRDEARKIGSIDQGGIRVLMSKTDEQGVTFSLIFTSDESPFPCLANLRETIVLRLLNEHVTIR